MQFINILVHSVECMNYRVFLQYEFTIIGLDEYLEVSLYGIFGFLLEILVKFGIILVFRCSLKIIGLKLLAIQNFDFGMANFRTYSKL